MSYHNAPAANNTGLPKFSGPILPKETANTLPAAGLTDGGKVIFQRTRRPPATCNLLARLAGIGTEASYG